MIEGMTAPTVWYPFAEWLITMSRLRGPVFFGWLGWPYAYLIGSEANEFVFAHDSHFRQREAFKGLIPVDGPTSVVVSDGEHHTGGGPWSGRGSTIGRGDRPIRVRRDRATARHVRRG